MRGFSVNERSYKLPWAYAHGISLIQASLVQHPPYLAPRYISFIIDSLIPIVDTK